MNQQNWVQQHLLRNYISNIVDGTFFGWAIGFASVTTVIPLFVSNMTDSAVLIGLIPAIHTVGWQLPQLFTAKWIGRMSQFKPFVLLMTINERLPYLGLFAIALLYPRLGKQTALLLTFAILIWQGLGAGFTGNVWQNFIAKIIPPDYIATFFGMQSAAANLFGSLGAYYAGVFIDGHAFPNNFALCFIVAFGMMIVSWFGIAGSYERPRVGIPTGDHLDQPILKTTGRILAADHNFRNYLITRMLAQFGLMAFAFYTVFAVDQHGVSARTIGLMTSVLFIVQVASNPILGWLADRWGRKSMLEVGTIANILSAVLAWMAPSPNWFFAVFLLAGLANSSQWTIGLALTLEFGNEDERPTYIGMANTLIVPAAILAPLVGGWMADHSGYQAAFVAAAVAALIAGILLHFFVADPGKRFRKPKDSDEFSIEDERQ